MFLIYKQNKLICWVDKSKGQSKYKGCHKTSYAKKKKKELALINTSF